jgi:MFS family permease
MTRPDLLLARIATSAIFFGNGFGIGTWAAQLPRFKAELELSDGQLSLALLAFSLGAVAIMPIVGWVAAAIGSRTTALTAAFAFAPALLLPGLAPNLALFIAASLLAGACNGTMDIAMNTNATVVEKTWGEPIMSSFHAFFSLGGLAGAAASGLLIAGGFDIFSTLLLSCTAMGLVFLIAALWMIEETEKAAGGHVFVRPSGAVTILATLAMLCFLVEGAVVDWSAIYLQTVTGASLQAAVTGFATFSLAMTICRFMGDFAVRHLGRVRTVQIGGFLAASGLTLAMLLPQPLSATIGFALVGIGLANTVPVLFSTAGQIEGIPPSVGVAMVATLGYGGFLLGPPLIGFGGDIISLRAMLGLLVVFALSIIILSQRALRPSTVQFCQARPN